MRVSPEPSLFPPPPQPPLLEDKTPTLLFTSWVSHSADRMWGPGKGCLTILLASFFFFSLLPSPGTLFFFPSVPQRVGDSALGRNPVFKKMLCLGKLSCNQRGEEGLIPLSGDHFCQGGKFRGRERSVGPMGIYWLNVMVAHCSEVRLRKFPSTKPPALLLQV